MMTEMGENIQKICGLSVIRLFEIRLAMESTFIALDGVDWTGLSANVDDSSLLLRSFYIEKNYRIFSVQFQ
jgi:hypothetical protein